MNNNLFFSYHPPQKRTKIPKRHRNNSPEKIHTWVKTFLKSYFNNYTKIYLKYYLQYLPFVINIACYVEKILKAGLDSILSPSVKISNYGRENFLEVLRWNIAGCCQQTFKNKKFVDTQQCFAFMSQSNFPAHNLNFHWRWRFS